MRLRSRSAQIDIAAACIAAANAAVETRAVVAFGSGERQGRNWTENENANAQRIEAANGAADGFAQCCGKVGLTCARYHLLTDKPPCFENDASDTTQLSDDSQLRMVLFTRMQFGNIAPSRCSSAPGSGGRAGSHCNCAARPVSPAVCATAAQRLPAWESPHNRTRTLAALLPLGVRHSAERPTLAGTSSTVIDDGLLGRGVSSEAFGSVEMR